MGSISALNCLFCHKCNDDAHRIGGRLRNALEPIGVCLQTDPFNIGDDADTRMQTFNIEAVLFLSTPESLASQACRLELKSAARQRLPIFAIHENGERPRWLKKRSYWQIPPEDAELFDAGIEALATSVRTRVYFNRKIRLLHPANYFHETIEVAREIATSEDRTIVAEFARELARRYRTISDPTTRYWIALALGRADTVAAAKLITKLPVGDHPLEQDGIRQAREMLHQH